MEEREMLILEFERLGNEISFIKHDCEPQKISTAPEDVKEWLYAIADFILEDRKRIVDGYRNILRSTECCKEDAVISDLRRQCRLAIQNAGIE